MSKPRKSLVTVIADRLMTMSYGTKNAQRATRLALMQRTEPHSYGSSKERNLGGMCRSVVESEIATAIANYIDGE